MKKNLFACMLVFTGVMAMTSPVFSQETTNEISFNTQAPVLMQESRFDATPVNAKAARDFKKSFAIAEGAKWYKTEKGYMVFFTTGDTKFRVDYDKKGNWKGTLKGYTEAQLNSNIRTIVKSVYFDYKIEWIWEINVPDVVDGPIYIVHVEDEKGFKNLRVYDGEMKVLEQYEK